jgi:hypothetical protein
MAKAADKPKPVKSLRRLPVDELFQLLLPNFKLPHAARERLERAISTGEVFLWGDDTAPNPIDVNFFTAHLRVTAWPRPDGSWTAAIEQIPGKIGVKDFEKHVWTVTVDVESLLESSTKRSGGRPHEYDHEKILIKAAVMAHVDGLPPTRDEFADKVANAIKAEGGKAPEDTQLRKILRPLYEALEVALKENR